MAFPLEAVPNFSEGRDLGTIDALGAAVSAHAELLDVHADADHNRSVFTLVGDEAALVEALVAGVACARDRIDLREHEGAHPRIGAADVVPVVPIRPEDRSAPARRRSTLARRLGEEVELPVFLYGDLAPGRGPRVLPARRARSSCSGGSTRVSWRPTSALPRLDERAGGVIVGARRPLIAFNVNLRGELAGAQEIAAVVRERGGGFPGVRALGLDLPRAGFVQVSMNVEDWEAAALHEIVARIEQEAAARGLEVVGSELVGPMPAGAAAAAAGSALRIEGFDASRVLELRLLG